MTSDDNKHACREQAQKHYQKLTKELTQGQLLRLEHRQTFVQQASYVLLRGQMVVKGQAAGAHLAFLLLQLSAATCVTLFYCVWGFMLFCNQHYITNHKRGLFRSMSLPCQHQAYGRGCVPYA